MTLDILLFGAQAAVGGYAMYKGAGGYLKNIGRGFTQAIEHGVHDGIVKGLTGELTLSPEQQQARKKETRQYVASGIGNSLLIAAGTVTYFHGFINFGKSVIDKF